MRRRMPKVYQCPGCGVDRLALGNCTKSTAWHCPRCHRRHHPEGKGWNQLFPKKRSKGKLRKLLELEPLFLDPLDSWIRTELGRAGGISE